MKVVLIAGGSGSGKTKLSELLLSKLKQLNSACLSIKMDDYYKEIPEGVDLNHYKKTSNFDNPDSLDLDLLKNHIMALQSGKSIDKPVFDFKTERRIAVESIVPPAILVIDGTSALYFAQNYLTNFEPIYKIFIEVEPETLLQRRIERDILERGYADNASIVEKDKVYVGPTYVALIEPTKKYADIIIDNNEPCDDISEGHPLVKYIDKIVGAMRWN